MVTFLTLSRDKDLNSLIPNTYSAYLFIALLQYYIMDLLAGVQFYYWSSVRVTSSHQIGTT